MQAMANGRRGPPRWRYLLDVLLLAGFVFAFPAGLQVAGLTAPEGELRYAYFTATALAPVLFGWLLLRLRGQHLADIGLKRPDSWPMAVGLGLVTAAAIFGLVWLSEQAGMKRDLSGFAELQGDLPLTLAAMGFAVVGAGFCEEFIFRGFGMRSFAGMFGDGRAAWASAVVLQAILFGLGHGVQGLWGVALTGSIALVVGTMFLAAGRNLWPLIVAHAVYDVARFGWFYLNGV